MIPGTQLIIATELPAVFRIASTYHLPIVGRVVARGERVVIRICNDVIRLSPDQRVAVCVE
jgi:hypothetical protein